MVINHVGAGREAVSCSEFDTSRRNAAETVEAILDREMPPGCFTALGRHPEAALTDARIAELVDGLRLTPGMGKSGGNGQAVGEDCDDHEEHEDDD